MDLDLDLGWIWLDLDLIWFDFGWIWFDSALDFGSITALTALTSSLGGPRKLQVES